MEKIFLKNEIEYFDKFKNKLEHIAGFFCAKEAVIKALNPLINFNFLDIEITHTPTGLPKVKLSEKLYKEFKEKYNSINISISHSKKVAVAVCEVN